MIASSRTTPSRTPARGSSPHCRERTRLSTGLEAHLLVVVSFDIDSRDSFCGFFCRYGCLVETRFPRCRGAQVWLFIKVGLYDPLKQVCRLSRSATGVISSILPPVKALTCRLISGDPHAGRSLPRRRRAFRAPIDGACCPAIGAALGAAERQHLSTR